jgi:hypothetical protein
MYSNRHRLVPATSWTPDKDKTIVWQIKKAKALRTVVSFTLVVLAVNPLVE